MTASSLLSPVHFLGISPYKLELVEKLLSGSLKKKKKSSFSLPCKGLVQGEQEGPA